MPRATARRRSLGTLHLIFIRLLPLVVPREPRPVTAFTLVPPARYRDEYRIELHNRVNRIPITRPQCLSCMMGGRAGVRTGRPRMRQRQGRGAAPPSPSAPLRTFAPPVLMLRSFAPDGAHAPVLMNHRASDHRTAKAFGLLELLSFRQSFLAPPVLMLRSFAPDGAHAPVLMNHRASERRSPNGDKRPAARREFEHR